MTEFSRNNPSKRYMLLLEQYQKMHEQGEKLLGILPENTFSGISLIPQAERIKKLIDLTATETLLDYGCGKGLQYERKYRDAEQNTHDSVLDYWDVEELICYDPGYKPYSELPTKKYNGVISTDVLEHCPIEDIPWIVDEIFSYAENFVFANIASYPAQKSLPNGENAHCTQQGYEWWEQLIHQVSSQYSGVKWEFWLQSKDNEGALEEQRLSNIKKM